ncbi:hypothetical protein BDA99DRAFT_523643 [Phascolomyces articulosus]|uniref:Uncharacterized protein n=1 Tax=Phascolomyces articulosus TaxID=60185 RepID=A0AAD5JQP6_9FUNG|nr:hypothetical protein BDA99DRAFT_523643 [Phascolomyces articulosus]
MRGKTERVHPFFFPLFNKITDDDNGKYKSIVVFDFQGIERSDFFICILYAKADLTAFKKQNVHTIFTVSIYPLIFFYYD